MKKSFIYAAALLLGSSMAYAQVSTEPPKPDEIDPDKELKIIVNINALDATQEYVQNLQEDAANGMDLYIWTWSPAEHPVGHPLVNGLGDRAWQNSNDSLKMTKESDGIYSFTMIPTEFYEVTAQDVYANDIKFLVKPQNGGGFGDPDRKSDDLEVLVDPPSLERNPAYLFPGRFVTNDLVLIYYDNTQEEKEGMQNLGDDEAYVYAEAELSDSSVVRIANNSFTVGSFPELKMDSYGNGIFKKYFIPRDLFNVPAGLEVTRVVFFIQKKTFITPTTDRLDYDMIANLGCD